MNEIHNLSNEQYLSRTRNYLFISNTNLVRFMKRMESKKLVGKEAIYELGLISTTLASNIEDAMRFLCINKNSPSIEIDKDELTILLDSIRLCISNFMKAMNLLPKVYSKDRVLNENMLNITKAGERIYTSCNIDPKNRKFKDLKSTCTELKKMNPGNKT